MRDKLLDFVKLYLYLNLFKIKYIFYDTKVKTFLDSTYEFILWKNTLKIEISRALKVLNLYLLIINSRLKK